MTMHNHDANMAHSEHMAQANTLANPADATHVAISSGAWSDPNTWEGGRIPGSEAEVYIPSSVMVTYDMDSDTALSTIRVDGHLKWSTSQDTSMLVETIVTAHGSKLEVGSSENPIPDNINATITFRDTPINRSEDPDQLSHGLVAFGEVNIEGAAKESYLTLEGSTNRGDRTIEVDGNLNNWEVGDTLLLVGTGNGSADEERVITSINGGTITLDRALSYDHNSVDGFNFDTFVGNLSRNVTFESENPEGVRGHIMMHNGMGDESGISNSVKYAAFDDLGRTDVSRETGTSDNPLGRYPLHLHEIGTESTSALNVIEGNAVNGSPGWGITHHSSHANINDNIVQDTVGSGIISEMGDETGEWIGNLVTNVDSTGTGDVGSEGAAYENQSRVIIQQENIAANSSIGWNFSGREDFELGPTLDGEHRKMFDRDQVPFDPSPFDVALDHEEPPLVNFDNNTVIASSVGLRVFHRQTSDDTDTMSILRNFDVWGGSSAVTLDNYASNYEFVDSTWVGSNTGFSIARKTSSVVFNNVDFVGFDTGYKSHAVNHEVIMIDTDFIGVGQEFDQFDLLSRVEDEGLKRELLAYYRDQHNIDYANPLPQQYNSSDLTIVDKVTFRANADADLTIGPRDASLNITGIITDSVGERRFNEYVIAKTPKGTGSSKDFEGVSLNFGAGNDERKKEFTTEEFISLHGTFQKADGSWVVPVVNWITDRLTAENHPVIIEISLVGYEDGVLEAYELDAYPNPGINNADWFTNRESAVHSGATSGHHDGGSAMDHGDHSGPVQDQSGSHDGLSDMSDGLNGPAMPAEEPAMDMHSGSRDDRDEQTDSNIMDGGHTDEQAVDHNQGPTQQPVDAGNIPNDGSYAIVEGTNGADRLRASEQDTILIGRDGDDRLFGGSGDDIFYGGNGRDRLFGGDGADTFVAETSQIDDIFDFSIAEGDTLDLSDVADFYGLSAAELDGAIHVKQLSTAARIDLHLESGVVKLVVLRHTEASEIEAARPWFIDAETTQVTAPAEDPVTEVTEPETQPQAPVDNSVAPADNTSDPVDPAPAETGNIIQGGAGKDYLYGTDGADTIDGGAGKNWLYGGDGNDTFVFGLESLDGKRDELADFSASGGDKIDLSAIAAGTGMSAAELAAATSVSKNGIGSSVSIEVDGVSYNILAAHGTSVQEIIENEALIF